MSNHNFVSWYDDEKVGFVTIDNPPVNALRVELLKELETCLEEIKDNQNIRAVIITSANNKIFIGGANIKELPSLIGKKGKAAEFVDFVHDIFNNIENFPKPVIAAINGWALGGGCELALACDLRIASKNAKLGFPEIKLGLFPGGGGTQRLPRLIGEAKAKELMYLGDEITAEEALHLGLVNRVVPPEEVLETSKAIGKEIAKRPGVAITLLKQCINQSKQAFLKEGLQFEIENFDRVFLTEDVKEGIEAFMNNTKPVFKHK